MDSYLGSLRNDIEAVKNAISHKYNNGLAEGSVNKIKSQAQIGYIRRGEFDEFFSKISLNIG